MKCVHVLNALVIFGTVISGAPVLGLTSSADDADTAGIFEATHVETYEIELEPGVLEWLRLNARKERFVPAKLRFRGRRWADVAMRFKGGFGTLEGCFHGAEQICRKLSVKLRFDRFDSTQLFHGLRRLNFHAMVRDPSLLREHLAYSVFRGAGVPAPRTAFARVVLNGRLEGLFLLVEAIDQSFAERAFPDAGRGSLYKEAWPGCDDEQVYRRALKTHETADGARRMVSFGKALANAPGEEYGRELARWLDVNSLLRYLAVDQAIGNWDGVRGWYCRGNGCSAFRGCVNHNYYWYQEASEDRHFLIPWDLDQTFQPDKAMELAASLDDPCGPFFSFNDPNTTDPKACDPLLARIAPPLWDGYVEIARRLLDGPLSPRALEPRIAALQLMLEEHVAEDPNGPGLADWRRAAQDLREDVRALHRIVRGQLGLDAGAMR